MGRKLLELYGSFSKDRCTLMAASLAYYAVFSLPGILILVVSIATLLYDGIDMQGQLTSDLGKIFGKNGAEQITTILESASQSGENRFASLMGTLLVIVGATGFVAQLQEALNICWGSSYKEEGGFLRVVFKRLLSLAMILTVTFLLLISFSVNTFLGSASETYLSDTLGDNIDYLVISMNFLTSFVFQVLLFASIYKILPERKLKWREVWLGATVTSLLFTLGRAGLEYYILNQGVGSTYGAAASLVILLTWVYYTTLILLLGAEVTKVFGKRIDTSLA